MANTKTVIPPIRGNFEAIARVLVRPVGRPNPAHKMTTTHGQPHLFKK